MFFFCVYKKNMASQTDYSRPLEIASCVYVLRCVGNRRYVGVTRNGNQRWAEHWSGRGSKFTREYPPESVEAVHYPGDLKRVTLELIRMHGFNHDGTPCVRGGPWAGLSSSGPKNMEENPGDGSPENSTVPCDQPGHL